jgi:hypothetical protein
MTALTIVLKNRQDVLIERGLAGRRRSGVIRRRGAHQQTAQGNPNHCYYALQEPSLHDENLRLDEVPIIAYKDRPEPDTRQRWPADMLPYIVLSLRGQLQ